MRKPRRNDISLGQLKILLVAGVALILGLLALVSAVFYNVVETGNVRDRAEIWRSHTLEVIIAADRLEADLLDRQRIVRGFLLTGNESFLDGLDFHRTEKDVARLGNLLRAMPDQKARMAALRPLVALQNARSEKLVQRARAEGISSASTVMAGGWGDWAMSQSRGVIQDIVREERMALIAHTEQLSDAASRSRWYIYAFGVLGFFLIAIAGIAGGLGVLAANRIRLRQMSDRIDDEIRANEERSRLAHESSGIGTWEFDPVTGMLLWSREMYVLYGRDVSLGPPRPEEWLVLVPLEDTPFCPWIDPRNAVDGFSRREFRINRPDGSLRWISSTAHPFVRDGSRRVIGTDADVSERKDTEVELKRLNDLLYAKMTASEAVNSRIFEMAPVLLGRCSSSGRMLSVNSAWSDLLGFSVNEFLAMECVQLFAEEDRHLCFDADIRLASGTKSQMTARMIARDGSIRIVEWNAIPSEDGEEFFLAGRDVTEQRETESRLKSAEEQVAQMTKIETLGQLTGGVAHDFNNLLTPIVGSLDSLKRRFPDDPKAQRSISMGEQAAERARVLVSRLLAFARRQHLQAQDVDVGRLIGGMEDLIARSLGPQIEVGISVPADLPDVKVDPNQLELAILNLSVNARDAMPEGGSLSIRMWRKIVTAPLPDVPVAPGNYVVICVSDTGLGMDEATLRRAIEPFYSTKGVGKGTGLGLSMVHGLAAQSGGALALSSRVGEGTTASLWLPVALGGSKPVVVAVPDQTIVVGRELSILVVDDEELVRSAVSEMLTGMGHSVAQASSGAAALDLLRAPTPYDLMVTDYLMPSMKGGELIRAARKLRPDLKALLVTGFSNFAADSEDADVPRLAKPFGVQALAAAVAGVMDRGQVIDLAARRTG